MIAVNKHLKKNKFIYVIIFLFFLAKLLTIQSYGNIWWDSAVYIGMGKYIYSIGNAGLWESSRPIVWPLMLGFLWKTGFDAVLLGRLVEIVFGSLCILLTYIIGKKLFKEKTALLSSIFLALSPTFFFFNGVMLTEIISTVFSLSAIYFFINKKHLASGMFFGIAFMTRYLQLFVFVAIIVSVFNIKNIKKMLLGFVIAITPLLVINQIIYNNALFPFFEQIAISGNSGWFNHQPLSFYFIELFKENFLYLLFIPGLILMLKNTNKKPIALAFTMLFIFFNLIKQKEMRFLIILLSYMYLMVSYSFFYALNNSKDKIFKNCLAVIVITSFALSLFNTYNYYKNESNKNNQYTILQSEFGKIGDNARVWISNPLISVFSNKKIEHLMYYPFFDEKKKEELVLKEKPNYIFLDTCDLACRLQDKNCENSKMQLLEYFKKELKIIHYSEINRCKQIIFLKTTS